MFRLRELEERDLPAVNRWRADPELTALLGAPFRYICPQVDRDWYRRYLAERGSAVRCAVVTEADEPIGLASLLAIDPVSRGAQLHILIGPREYRGRGAGSYAVRELLRHAFLDRNLHRVELEVLSDNRPARHVYEKAGFVLEGRRREAVYKNGRYADLCLYAVLKEDFLL